MDGVADTGDEVAAVWVAGEGAVELGAVGGGEGVAKIVTVGGVGVGDGEGGVGNGGEAGLGVVKKNNYINHK